MSKRQPTSRIDTRATTRIQYGLEERASWWDRLMDYPLVWAAIAVVFCSWLLIPRVGRNVPLWAPGEVAAFDVAVPRDMTLPDEAATEVVRDEARNRVLPVYDLEPRLQYELVDGIRTVFAVCRAGLEEGVIEAEVLTQSSLLQLDESMLQVIETAQCSPEVEKALVEVAGQVYSNGVVDDVRGLERRGDLDVVLRNLSTGEENRVSIRDLGAPVDLRVGLEPAIRTLVLAQDSIPRRWIRPTVAFLESNMAANLVFNRGETTQRMAHAASQVQPRSRVFRRGQVLLRRGDTVTPEVAQALVAIHEQRLEMTTYSTLAGIILLMVLVIVGWWWLPRHLTSTVDWRSRLSTVFVLLVLFTAFERLGLYVATAVALNAQGTPFTNVETYIWGLPYAAGPIVALLLLEMQSAVLFALCSAMISGVMLGGDFTVTIFALVSGLVGAWMARRFKDRTIMTRAGVIVGLVNVAVLGVLQLYTGWVEAPQTLLLSAACAFAGGPLAVGIASSVLPILEGMFGITTDIRLLELSNQNLPLLKRLSLEAPGTFQHSLAVGNLAEAGADAVGANSLLLRVASYYHDIGKLVKPEYFVENQRGPNPHDTLSPSMSALVIQSHVKEGLAMGRKAKLPLAIRHGIATHHGTKLIRYFYNRAKDQLDPGMGEVRESDYRYSGPKPHTKELGILLLADAVEAAARTLEQPTPSKIQNMINRIFSDALEDGQLDTTELTFKELDKVASAFLWVLTNMYHHRIDYPGFDFNRRRKQSESGPIQLGTKTVPTRG